MVVKSGAAYSGLMSGPSFQQNIRDTLVAQETEERPLLPEWPGFHSSGLTFLLREHVDEVDSTCILMAPGERPLAFASGCSDSCTPRSVLSLDLM
ncbi:Kat8 Regulatory Nsl Complex Subunit 1-Like Protein [Manis pentadactyla]|nr:Kat8 Regulatory Nsl Complex Subunit 1-Like Protein [Manis pentadactyla]